MTCRGPASLDGFFRLTDRRKVAGKRTNCATARKVVRRFPRSCSEAYAAQGSCNVRASGRWRCRSRIVGSLFDGSPSREKCKHGGSRLKFEVARFPPTEPSSRNRLALRRAPYDEGGRCVDTSEPGTVIPPPDPAAGSWEIHLMRGVRRGVGEDLQSALVTHRVSPILHAGLGSQPQNHPDRIPIFLPRGDLDSEGNLGITAPTCANDAVDGIVVTTRQPAGEIASTAAHELFHAYSIGLNPSGDAWWEEAAATWSEGRVGFGEATLHDDDLQHPMPLDTSDPDTYPYAMSRFVQFLDDRGFIGDPAWPLQRRVINGYESPGATAALAAAVKESGGTLGAELGAFWGDRLRATPLHGPQLRPTAWNTDRRVRVRHGRDLGVKSGRLDARLIDFRLAADVKRVEFEFDPPAEDGFFWGLVAPDDSRPFGEGDFVSFCVGGGDEDDLEWPGHFPVTFTNGGLGNGTIAGTVTVEVQTGAEQCTNPELNRACRLLSRARVGQVVEPGEFHPSSPRDDIWHCVYLTPYESEDGTDAYRVRLNLFRLRRAGEARRAVRRASAHPPPVPGATWQRINVGDAAAIWTNPDSGTSLIVVAVGREFFQLWQASRPQVITLARRVARELD